MFRLLTKMSQEYTLSAFLRRSNLAEEKLVVLRQHLQKIKDQAVSSAIKEKESRLRSENESLKQKVANLKTQLIAMETVNGIQQVKMPNKSAQPTVQREEKPPKAKPETVKAEAPKKETKKSKAKQDEKPKKAAPKTNEQKPVDVSRLDMRVAKIVTVKHHPDAESLYMEEIDVGEESLRSVVTGVVKHIPIDQMQDRMVVLMCNLKPAKMRGVLSQAMVMCADNVENIEIIDPPAGSVPGDKISFDGYPGEPDAMLNPKKKVWEKVQPDLKTNDECVACYKGVPFKVEGKGICKVQTLKNCRIK
uniref:Aminoacyl tRNA synthase complex-interacting multifunctional protein 1 n=1 Tax=Phallusia mammillata TaxID=59560 RepID=A0A6F9D5J6_9ASCI|nr:aminoacyl tRNA synthase complex-interacting multifunctional protein 1 [Phallusia mammillata]